MSSSAESSEKFAENTSVVVGKRSQYCVFAAHAMTLSIILSAAVYSSYPLQGKLPWMMYEEDDFFYYLKIAGNLAHGLGSTFNGLVPTNGYHPLWLALLALVVRISPAQVTPQIFLTIAVFCSSIATYFLCRRLLASHVNHPLLANTIAGSITIYSMHVYNGGMEVILTIPLLLAVAVAYQGSAIWLPKLLPPLGFGLLLSALFLSRLDTILIGVLLAMMTLIHPALRARLGLRQIAGVLLGLIPMLVYFLSNHVFFHTWLPVSGMAKQLKFNHLPSWPAWRSVHSYGQVPHACFILIAVLVLPRVYRRLTSTQQVIYPLLLFFPFLYISVLSCLSDWPLWAWYFYAFRPAICISFAILLQWDPTNRLFTHSLIVVALSFLVFAQVLRNRRTPGEKLMYSAAAEVNEFAATHPGTYAMGDRSGMVGYLLSDPLVQTEGLVMDRDFLTLIRRETPLKLVFAKYHVHYYVAITPDTEIKHCFHAVEPLQAGPGSPHIVDDFCQAPIATITNFYDKTLIFDVGGTN